MKALQLFDLYLPHTMNWAWQLMQATPEVEQWVAAPWMLKNEYSSPEFRFFTRPLQEITGVTPSNEWTWEWFSTNLIRAEKRWPIYRNYLYQQLKNDPPDVLHAHFGPLGCHYLPLAQKLNRPLITSFYGFDYARLPFEKPVYLKRYRQLFEQSAAVTTTGELSRKWLEDLGCPPEKIHPIPLIINPLEFPWVKRTKIPGRLRLVQVATITDKKGHLDTLEALKIARQQCPDIHLTIAGERQDPKLFRQMQEYIQVHDLARNVQLQDFLPHQQLASFLGQFEVFIHPSRLTARRDCEGSPVAILEAMSTGLPVLSTLHSDIPRQVLHERTGFLVPERSPDQLAQYLNRFYHMDNLEYQAMSLAAHQHVQQNFEVKQSAQKLWQLYQNSLGEASRLSGLVGL